MSSIFTRRWEIPPWAGPTEDLFDLWLAAADIPGVPSASLTSLGVIALALVTGLAIAYRWGLVPERERANRYEEEVKRLNTIIIERVLPAVVSATGLLAEIAEKQPLRRDHGGVT